MHAGEKLPNIPLKGSELTFDPELFYRLIKQNLGRVNHEIKNHIEFKTILSGGGKMIIVTLFSEEFYLAILITVMLNTFSNSYINIFNM